MLELQFVSKDVLLAYILGDFTRESFTKRYMLLLLTAQWELDVDDVYLVCACIGRITLDDIRSL